MNFRKAFRSKFAILVVIDLIMMLLLVSNLTLIIFDWIYEIPMINHLLSEYLPGFHKFYDTSIHQNFDLIDLLFVSVFLGEFLLSWVLSIISREYHRWFYYPFLHWYDLLGCIPVGSMRFLRVLRVISILVRLQKLEVIDLYNTYFGMKFRKYYAIVVEEVSDRVVVNILEGIQEELKDGGPVMDQIINNVIKPRQQLIVEWISNRIALVAERDLVQKKEEISDYVKSLLREGIKSNAEIKALERVPVMGKMAVDAIERSIGNTIISILEKAISDLASDRNKPFIEDTTVLVLDAIQSSDADKTLNQMFIDIPVEVLEIVKDQVKVKKWKIKADAGKGGDLFERSGVEFLLTDDLEIKQEAR